MACTTYTNYKKQLEAAETECDKNVDLIAWRGELGAAEAVLATGPAELVFIASLIKKNKFNGVVFAKGIAINLCEEFARTNNITVLNV